MPRGRPTDAKLYRTVAPPDGKPPEGRTPVILAQRKSKAVLTNRQATDVSEPTDRFGGEVDAESEISGRASDSDVDVDAQPGESPQSESVAGSSSTVPSKWKVGLEDGYYERCGKTYRCKIDPDVNAAHCVEDIQNYVDAVEDEIPSEFASEKKVPYNSTQDFTSTMRSASSSVNSAFQGTYDSLSYHKTVDLAFHHCSPGLVVVLKNCRDIPARFYETRCRG